MDIKIINKNKILFYSILSFYFFRHLLNLILFNIFDSRDGLILQLWNINYEVPISYSLSLWNLLLSFLCFLFIVKTFKGKSYWEQRYQNKKIFYLKAICLISILTVLIISIFNQNLFSFRYNEAELADANFLQYTVLIFNQLNIPLIFIVQSCIKDSDKSKGPILFGLLTQMLFGAVGLGSVFNFLVYLLFVLSFKFKLNLNFLKKLFSSMKISKKFIIILLALFLSSLFLNNLYNLGVSRKLNISTESSLEISQKELAVIAPAFIVRNSVDNASLIVHSIGNKEPECIKNENTLFNTIKLNFYRLNRLLKINYDSDIEPKSISRINVFAINNCIEERIGPKEGTSMPFSVQILRTFKEFSPLSVLTNFIFWMIIVRFFWFVSGRYISYVFYSKNIIGFIIVSITGPLIGNLSIDNLMLLVDDTLFTTLIFIFFRNNVILPQLNNNLDK